MLCTGGVALQLTVATNSTIELHALVSASLLRVGLRPATCGKSRSPFFRPNRRTSFYKSPAGARRYRVRKPTS
jgi:hypothetical protein